MARPTISPTGVERTFDEDQIIVSKTDTKGILTYTNRLFLDIAGYKEDEVLGQPHNMIRHPDMPRCIFELLWKTISQEKEIFAYVMNMAKNGDHYWVLAHVTPILDKNKSVLGYHSSRRVPESRVMPTIKKLYADLLQLEKSHSGSPKEALAASMNAIDNLLKEKGVSYDEFIHNL
ncbi:MAG: PAS domain-containing protein [Alphaproteobacteria bacterium]